MELVIDFDNTIVNTDKAIWELYRLRTGDLSTNYKDHSVWWYDEICPLWSREEQNNAFQDPELFDLLEPMPDAIRTLKELSKDKHSITVCTVHKSDGVPYKAEWIYKHINFIDNLVIVDERSKGHKSMVAGDILLDDNIENLRTSACDTAVAFGKGKWNKDWHGPRATSWPDFYDVVSKEMRLSGLWRVEF